MVCFLLILITCQNPLFHRNNLIWIFLSYWINSLHCLTGCHLLNSIRKLCFIYSYFFDYFLIYLTILSLFRCFFILFVIFSFFVFLAFIRCLFQPLISLFFLCNLVTSYYMIRIAVCAINPKNYLKLSLISANKACNPLIEFCNSSGR